ncbi:hypothetical protein AB1Y20_020290 [Prymnesium parvum]|uniref:Uncharacterized protein n=1 Tax=Prymnesium parvum TaxID=97485 RepID=A0AB34JWZ6_PRYPA
MAFCFLRKRPLNMRKQSTPQSRQRFSPLTPSPFPTLDVEQSSSFSPATQVSATPGGEARQVPRWRCTWR